MKYKDFLFEGIAFVILLPMYFLSIVAQALIYFLFIVLAGYIAMLITKAFIGVLP